LRHSHAVHGGGGRSVRAPLVSSTMAISSRMSASSSTTRTRSPGRAPDVGTAPSRTRTHTRSPHNGVILRGTHERSRENACVR
jgi:hypothetical protein